ncbi:glycosyltransferase family 39 protein [Engelhardtia mirabilis]|uniref:Glycosyltransferase RgtA/B/C/D-like domain-containing protein n=1 Tax=Engelhardtia mirabilis TaxID=2528011 RepID=A0A518BLD3_9BACT|nr:hypothetical protein Pla133_28750 [Planctomycetes bacterium Pla133]QDV02112.1 hypothetical protein Pla86_28740 [Planctomycetes bacterium Pla86]
MKRLGLWLAVLVHVVLAGTYAHVTPVFEAPDENGHLGYVWQLIQHGEPPVVKGSGELAGVPAWRQGDLGHHPALYYRILALGLRIQGLADLTPTPRSVELAQRVSGRHFEHGWDEVGARSREVRGFHRLRLFSVLCGAVSLVLIRRLVARALPRAPGAVDLSVLLLALLPGWSIAHSVLDNGALAVTMILGCLTLLVRAVDSNRLTPLSGLAAGALGGLALATKLTAVGVVPLFGLALAWIWWRAPQRRRETTVAGALGLALLVALWLPWILRNLELYGEPLATAVHERAFASNMVPDEARLTQLTYALPVLVFRSAVGVVGWNAASQPAWIEWLFGGTALLALAGLALGRGRIGLKSGPTLLLGASGLVAMALLLRFNLVFHQPQARYALAGSAGFALFAAAGFAALGQRVPSLARPLALALVAAWSAAALGGLARAKALFQIDPTGTDPAQAILVADLFTPSSAEPAGELARIGGDDPPVLTWPASFGRASIHLWCVDGPRVGGSFEHLGLAFENGRATLPAAVWASLPAGAQVKIKVRQLADRRTGQDVADRAESSVLVVRRP